VLTTTLFVTSDVVEAKMLRPGPQPSIIIIIIIILKWANLHKK